MKGIQVLGILMSAYLMAQTVVQYRRGTYGVKKIIFWLSLWALIATLFAFPSLTLLALPILTTQDAMLTVVVMGLILAFILVYQTYQQVVSLEQKLTELAQNIAIDNYLKKAMSNPEKENEQ